jgi:hypothetical protein
VSSYFPTVYSCLILSGLDLSNTASFDYSDSILSGLGLGNTASFSAIRV